MFKILTDIYVYYVFYPYAFFLYIISLHITIFHLKPGKKYSAKSYLSMSVTFSLIVTITVSLLPLFGYVLKYFGDLFFFCM